MIELRHLDVRHFVIEESRHLANVAQSAIMSGHNNMQYKYRRICFGICMQSL